MGPSKARAATRDEKKRMAQVVELGCVACRKDGLGNTGPAEVHHLLDGGKRIGHSATIALCRWHHRGICWAHGRASIIAATGMWGPSLYHDARAFHARYGSDSELLEYQNKLLEEAAANDKG